MQEVKSNTSNECKDSKTVGERFLITMCVTVVIILPLGILGIFIKEVLVAFCSLLGGFCLTIFFGSFLICIAAIRKSKSSDVLPKKIVTYYLVSWILFSVVSLCIGLVYLIPLYVKDYDGNIYCRYKSKTYIYKDYDYELYHNEFRDDYQNYTYYVNDIGNDVKPFFESKCYERYYSTPSTPSYYLE